MKRTTNIFLWSILVFSCSYANAAIGDSLSIDYKSEQAILHSFDQELIAQMQEDGDFRYVEPPENRANILKIVFQKVFKWLLVLVGNELVAWLILIILIIIGVVGLGFGLYGIFGLGKTVPIYGSDTNKLNYDVKSENIHEINFADEIELAVDQKNYKKAIRLMYLYALKMLSDNNIIDWKPSKTNHDYAYEIEREDCREQFVRLGYYFDFIWYGNFKAEVSHYYSMQASLNSLKDKLQSNA